MESFCKGLDRMCREGVKTWLYSVLLVKGVRMNSKTIKERYNINIKSAFRIMPRYTGRYGAINSPEYKELLISHSKFPEEDYFKIRLIVFLPCAVFSEHVYRVGTIREEKTQHGLALAMPGTFHN